MHNESSQLNPSTSFSEQKKRGTNTLLEGDLHVTSIEGSSSALEDLSFAADFPKYYDIWALKEILGVDSSDLRRFVYTDRDRRDGESDHEAGPDGRKRLFGEDELNALLLRCALVNVKPAHGDFVAIDAIRIQEDDDNLPWGSFESRGLYITNNSKTMKRLSTLTRDSFISGTFDNAGIDIEVVGHDDIGEYSDVDDDRVLDGATAISGSFYKMMCRYAFDRAGIDRSSSRGKTIWRRLMASKSGQFRMVNAAGTWKGDYLVSDSEYLPTTVNGELQRVHIKTFYTNCKTEVRWENGTFVHLEPHPNNHPLVYTDEQTHSWLLRHVFSPETLTSALRDLNQQILNDLAAGIVPEHIRKWTGIGEDEQDNGQISDLQRTIAIWVQAGFDIRDSSWMIKQLGSGHINMLKSRKKEYRFPIPNSSRFHVATQAWLRMADFLGDKDVPIGSGSYSIPAQRFVFSDEDFVRLYARHGGWDLDDTVVAIHCKIRSGREVWVIYRSPNGYGEYSVLNYVPESFRPHWRMSTRDAEGNFNIWEDNMITLSKLPKFLEEITPDFEHLPAPRPKPALFDIEAVKLSIREAGAAGNIGIWANSQMAWYWTNDSVRPNQLIPTEFAADACMQDRDPIRINLVEADIDLTIEQLKHGEPINRDLWKQRVRIRMTDEYQYNDKGLRAILRNKFDSAREEFLQQINLLAGKTPDRILPMLDFNYSLSTKQKSRSLRNYFANALQAIRSSGRSPDRADWVNIAQAISGRLALNTQEERTRMLLATAFVKYSSKRSDALLFQFNTEMDQSVVHFWIEALQAAAVRNMIRCLFVEVK